MSTESKPIFRDLTAEDPDPEVTKIESLCMNCHKNGMTRLLLTKIPFYKEVVLMSFSCDECGCRNNEIQPGGAVAEKGVRFTVKIEESVDLNRQCVKSDHASVRIVELDFEIPALSQKGEVTTIEGILDRAIAGLELDQPVRRISHPEDAGQLDRFIEKLIKLKDVDSNGGFTMILEDASGNSFVENPHAPQKDPRCHRVDFVRTQEENYQVGVFTRSEVNDEESLDKRLDDGNLLEMVAPEKHNLEHMLGEEVMTFKTNCPECNVPCDTNMKMTNIPHFKEVLIMAITCDSCGHRTNEVKSGGGIEPLGVKMEVKVRGREDFSRDILKSETCSLSIPELDLEVGSAALGGRFTTAEGLLAATKEQLSQGSAGLGDSSTQDRILAMQRFSIVVDINAMEQQKNDETIADVKVKIENCQEEQPDSSNALGEHILLFEDGETRFIKPEQSDPVESDIEEEVEDIILAEVKVFVKRIVDFYCTVCGCNIDTGKPMGYWKCLKDKVELLCDGCRKKFVCVECYRGFVWKSQLQIHIEGVHLKIKKYKCGECEKAFLRNGTLNDHIRSIHRKLKYSCQECDKSYSERGYLTKHIKVVHRKSINFACWICNKAFTALSDLKRHINRVHRKMKDFKCKECEGAFFCKRALNVHMQSVHLRLKPFACLKCKRSFSTRAVLNQHVNSVHLKVKKFICAECNYTCSQKGHIVQHINGVHLKLKPFLCTICERAFSTRSNYKLHAHSGKCSLYILKSSAK